MKTLFILSVFLLLGISSPLRALSDPHAPKPEQLELLKIGSEFYPDQTYTLGLEVDPTTRSLLAIFYRDPYPDAQTPFQRFPIASLARPQVMIRANNRYDVVKISMVGRALTVFFRKDVRESKWNSKRFELDCTSNLSSCSVLDPASHRYVTGAYITAHRTYIVGLFEKAVGIEDILTR